MNKIFKNVIAAALISASAFSAVTTTASAEWVKTEKGYTYTDEATGKSLKGWQEIDGKTYYFGSNGVRRTGLRKIGGDVYYFGKNGVMRTGKVKIGKKTYNFGADGKRIYKQYSVTVNGKSTDSTAYYEGEVLMLPAEAAAKALGYIFTYDGKTGTIVIDDDYIQKVTLTVGSEKAAFKGNLEVIDLTRDIDLDKAVVVKNDTVYVTAELFREFFNDVVIKGKSVDVSPSRMYLDDEFEECFG